MIKKFRIYFLAIILLIGIFGETTAFAKESAVVPLEVVNKGTISKVLVGWDSHPTVTLSRSDAYDVQFR